MMHTFRPISLPLMRSLHNLQDLRIFLAVAETGSLTQAAKRLYLSLSAASLRLQKLEETLGCRLVERSPKGLSLTDAGRELLSHASSVMGEMDKLERSMADYAQENARRLRIAGNYNASIGAIPDVIARFLTLNPQAIVEHAQMKSEDVVAAVALGSIDIGICAYEQSFQGVVFEPFGDYRLFIVAPPDHPLARQCAIDFEEALAYPFVALQDSAMQNFIFERMRDHGRSIEPRVRTTSIETLCDYVERGIGLGVLTGMAFERMRRQNRIRAIAIRDAWAQRTMRIALPASSQRMNRLSEEFLQLLREARKHLCEIDTSVASRLEERS